MERKFVIVRTRKGNTIGCHFFMTLDYHNSTVLPDMKSDREPSDTIELRHYVGGMLDVVLTTKKNNGIFDYEIIEDIKFEAGIVTKIEVMAELY